MRSFFFGCLFTVSAIVLVGFAILKLGLYPVNADADEPWIERKIAHMALNAHVEKKAAELKNPFTNTNDVLMEGMKTFKSNCAGCHGSPANQDTTFAYSLYPKAPQIGVKGMRDSAEEIFWMTKHGIRMSGMPSFAKMLDDDKIWKIAVFLRNLKELPAEVQTEWEKVEQ